jgi:hypothetical protein
LLSQLVHGKGWHLVPAHKPALHVPDEQEDDEVHELPSVFLVMQLPELR